MLGFFSLSIQNWSTGAGGCPVRATPWVRALWPCEEKSLLQPNPWQLRLDCTPWGARACIQARKSVSPSGPPSPTREAYQAKNLLKTGLHYCSWRALGLAIVYIYVFYLLTATVYVFFGSFVTAAYCYLLPYAWWACIAILLTVALYVLFGSFVTAACCLV